MLPETNTRRDTGLDSARAFALLLMLIPVSVSLNLVPGKHLSWLSQVLPQALNLFAVILGAAAYLYSRKVAFPQFFASSIVRFLAFCVLGWVLAQLPHSAFADQAFSGWKDFPIRFDMLLPLAVLTLLSIGLVYMPFWVQLAVTVLASPAVPFTYERLSVGGWTADDWLHRTIPAIVNESAGTISGWVQTHLAYGLGHGAVARIRKTRRTPGHTGGAGFSCREHLPVGVSACPTGTAHVADRTHHRRRGGNRLHLGRICAAQRRKRRAGTVRAAGSNVAERIHCDAGTGILRRRAARDDGRR